MDVAAFRAQLAAARRVEVAVGEAKFRLVLPTDHAWRVALEANRDQHGRLLDAQAFRAVLNTALVGWEGVKTTDLDPDAAEEPLPFTAELRGELLDARQDIADVLTLEVGRKLRERTKRRESARKN